MSISFKLFLSHALAVLLVSGSIGTLFYAIAVESLMTGLKERLQSSAALISQTIDARSLDLIQGPEDAKTREYETILMYLRTLRRMNPDIMYMYIMRYNGNRVVFVVDSDESESQAQPGDVYGQEVPALLKGFRGVSVDDEVMTDKWGSFLSGYAPLKNGLGEYLIGIDMQANEVRSKYKKLQISGVLSLVASIMLAFVFARVLAARFVVPVRLAVERCTAIAAGKLDDTITVRTNDELDQLICAFNDMSATLSRSEQRKQEAFEALRRSRDELDTRVRQRTADLKEVNDKLSHEIAQRLIAQKALHDAAMIDSLTRLHNRRSITERIEQEEAQAKRTDHSFTLVMADLDHFKKINDTYGHDAGDSVLEETALRMKSMLRANDTASRWGGEEFMILLPGTNKEQGAVVAEKIRCRIAEYPYYAGGREIYLTCSFGVAQFDGVSSVQQLVTSVDSALYRAKNAGRNRIEVYEENTAPESAD